MKQDPESKIYLVDDDVSVCRGITMLLLSAGYNVEAYNDVSTFLGSEEISGPGCLLLDIFLGGESGLDFQDTLKNRFATLPIIYITGHGDIPMSVRALKKGAIDFLQKPVDEKQLLHSVEEALSQSLKLVAAKKETDQIRSRIELLTPKELKIFRMVITGMLNKQIAAELNIAEHTVKLHRGRMTEKLQIKSVPEMVYMAEKLNIR